MRRALLPNDRALILRATTDMQCYHDNRLIDCGSHAVAIDTPRDLDSMVWFSLGGLDGLMNELQSFSPENPDELERFGPRNQYTYHRTSAGSSCIVCDKNEWGPRPKIEMRRGNQRSPPWLHLSCVPILCEILETVWEDTFTLLSESL